MCIEPKLPTDSWLIPLLYNAFGRGYKASPYKWQWLRKLFKCTTCPAKWAEWYVVVWLALLIVVFALASCMPEMATLWLWFAVPVAIVRLADIILYVGDSLFVSPELYLDDGKPCIRVRHGGRWLFLNFVNIFQIVLSFTLLRMTVTHALSGPWQPLKESLGIMFLSLPDSNSLCLWQKVLTFLQVAYCTFFFLFMLPVVVSALRVKVDDKAKDK